MKKYITLDFESIDNDYEYYKIGDNFYLWDDTNIMNEKVKLKLVNYKPDKYIECNQNEVMSASDFYKC